MRLVMGGLDVSFLGMRCGVQAAIRGRAISCRNRPEQI
jgi:hypothetical protein